MAQFSDILGRVTNIEGDMSKVRELLTQMLSAPVPVPTITADKEKEKSDRVKQIQEDISKLSDNFETYQKDTERWVQDIISTHKEQTNRVTQSVKDGSVDIGRSIEAALVKSHNKLDKGPKKADNLSDSLKKHADAIGDSVKSPKSPRTIRGDYDPNILIKNIEESIKAIPGNIDVYVKVDGMEGEGERVGVSFGNGFNKELDKALNKSESRYKKWGTRIASISSMLLGNFTIGQVTGITDPKTVSGQLDFIKNMRAIAFQTQSITSETRGLQREWSQTGKVVAQTGHRLQTFQEQLVDNLKRGVKNRQDGIKITKTGLQLSTMIGSNAKETAGLLNEWNMTLSLSSHEMSDLSRGIQDVAKWTGVTGDKLMQAVKSSEQFMKRMRAAGSHTAVAAKNIIMIQAMAQKIGVEDSMSDLMSGLANNADLLFNASRETKTLIFAAASEVGMIDRAMQGTILHTREGIKGLTEGLESKFRQISGFDIKDFDKMPQEMRSMMNLRFQATFGKGIEEFVKMHEVLEESGKGFRQRLESIDEQMKKNLTHEELRSLRTQKTQMALNASLEQSAKLADAAMHTDSITEAVDRLQQQAGSSWKNIQEDLIDMAKHTGVSGLAEGIQSGDHKSIAKAMALSSAKALKTAGGKNFEKEMLNAIESNNMSEIRSIQERMNDEQQKLGVKDAKSLTAMEQSVQVLNEVNEGVRGVVGGLLERTLDRLGGHGLILTQMAMSLSSMAMLGPKSGILDNATDFLFRGRKARGRAMSRGKKRFRIARKSLGRSRVGRGIGGLFKGAKGIMAGRAAAGAGVKAGVMGTGAALGAGIPGIGTAIAAAIGGVVGSFQAGAKAAELFQVEQDKLTMSQRMAAEGAGFLTGTLDFLTFGIFSKWIGPTGSITKYLAKFFDTFWPLGLLFQKFLFPIKILWGTLKGLWIFLKESFIGLWDGMKEAVKPIAEALQEVGDIFSDIMSSLNFFGKEGSGAVDVVEHMARGARWLGQTLGSVFRAVGKVIGFVIKTHIDPLILAFKKVGEAIKYITDQVANSWIGRRFGLTSEPKDIKEKTAQNVTKKDPTKLTQSSTPTRMQRSGIKSHNEQRQNKVISIYEKPKTGPLSLIDDKTWYKGVTESAMIGTNVFDKDKDHIKITPEFKSPQGSVTARPTSGTDMHSKVAQDKAGAEAGSGLNIRSPELVKIASTNYEQVELLREIAEYQKEIRNSLSGSNKSGLTAEQKRAATSAITKGLSNPAFYRWANGQYGENASQDIVTMHS